MSQDRRDPRPAMAARFAQAAATFAQASRAEDVRLEAEVSRAHGAAERAFSEAMTAANPGLTQQGNSLAQRAMAPWTASAWADQSVSAATHGVGGLVPIGNVLSGFAHPLGRPPTVPALLPFIGRRGAALFASGSASLNSGNDAIQGAVMRLVSVIPPTKLRLTLIDAAGLGENLSALLHLPETVKGPKVWHDEGEIEAALQELILHMSTVIGQYHLGRDRSIDEHNADAGEVSEPYRIAVIANYPAGFRKGSAERLMNIATNGARLGVLVLMTADLSRDLRDPQRDMVTASLSRIHDARGWTWETSPLGQVAVQLGTRPPIELIQALSRAVADALRADPGVQVPFERILPAECWKDSSLMGVEVPLGRQGATEFRVLRLGFDNEANACFNGLIGGMVGRGKSTMLHVLICGLALRYPPSEVEVFLVDFKEGVEFQVYRTLPQARVVAIKSEREFGVSVLSALRDEMVRRGRLFVEAGVENIVEYRRRTKQQLSRVLLLIDEFQVLFEANDSLATSARTLLDDLVRRGRGFGIHTILATQSLGSMELEASTLNQLGLRIALQLREGDSERILGRDNDEARFLTRPGEAIYNDRGGLSAGNRRFQVAQLPRERREQLVGQVQGLAGPGHRLPMVFEGSRPGRLASNAAYLTQRTPATTPRMLRFWLGEPTRMADEHECWRLRRQTRGNVIVVGHREGSAVNFLAVGLLGMLAQLPRAEDGTVAAEGEILNLANVGDLPYDVLDAAFQGLPVSLRCGDRPRVAPGLARVYQELERRIAERALGHPLSTVPWFILLFGAHRSRDLERAGGRASASLAHLHRILADGPDHGIHLLVWVESAAAMAKLFSTSELGDFGCRVTLSSVDAAKALGMILVQPPRMADDVALFLTEETPDHYTRCLVYGSESLEVARRHLLGQPLPAGA